MHLKNPVFRFNQTIILLNSIINNFRYVVKGDSNTYIRQQILNAPGVPKYRGYSEGGCGFR